MELGGHRAIDIILDELRAGASHLANLHGDRFVSLLVPPWNRIDPPLLAHLPKIGYTGVSVFGPEKPSPLRSVNTHVDLIDWKSTRGGRDPATLIQEIVARLKHNFDTDGTVGLLTHHLVHDQNAWSFLEQLFDQTSGHPACRWTAISDIFQTRMNFTSPL